MLNKTSNRYKQISGEKLPNTFENLKYYVDQCTDEEIPPYYVHFSSIEKVGINPKQEYNTTPLGVYFHPLNSRVIFQDKIHPGLYASKHENVFVIKPNPSSNIIWMLNNGDSVGVTSSEIGTMLDILESSLHPKLMDLFYKHYENPTFQNIYRFMKSVIIKYSDTADPHRMELESILTRVKPFMSTSDHSGTKAFTYFLKFSLGVDGICDTRRADNMIFPNEPQLVVFNSKDIEIVDFFKNDNSSTSSVFSKKSIAEDDLVIFIDLPLIKLSKFKPNIRTFCRDLTQYLSTLNSGVQKLKKGFPASLEPLDEHINLPYLFQELRDKVKEKLNPERIMDNYSSFYQEIEDIPLYTGHIQKSIDSLLEISKLIQDISRKNTAHTELQDFIRYGFFTVLENLEDKIVVFRTSVQKAIYYSQDYLDSLNPNSLSEMNKMLLSNLQPNLQKLLDAFLELEDCITNI